ncbi:MAG: hypothetical protein HQM09_21850 [Candidatus Riflebacteria bacterium]|nr:hypothetical protein [Candidatus Riflebacteria bacterium]
MHINNLKQPDRHVDYNKPIILCISSCGAKHQKLSIKFKSNNKSLGDLIVPRYIFVTADDEVHWSKALVGWAILYQQLPEIDFADNIKIKNILRNVDELGLGNFRYYRWDTKSRKYKIPA